MSSSNDPAPWFARLAQRREWLGWLNAGLLLLWFAATLLAFQTLPERMPMHFTLSGSPTRWETATLGGWLFLPLLALVLILLLPLMERVHHWLNRPYQVAPTDPRAQATWLRMRRTYLDLCATLLILSLGLLHWGVWLVATERAAGIPAALLAGSLGAIGGILLLIIPVHRATTALQLQR